MSKPFHKPRPSPPKWFFWDNDNCWFCEHKRGCTGCKELKKTVAKQKERNNKKQFKKTLMDF